ncbi:MAG: hypothetical protein OHK0023_27330 [Anaerolineae bacterium]
MFDHETLRGVLSLGFLIGGGGLVMVFLQPPNSAEFVLSLCSAMMGIVLVGMVFLLHHFFQRRGR